jgi:hypothetical protein
MILSAIEAQELIENGAILQQDRLGEYSLKTPGALPVSITKELGRRISSRTCMQNIPSIREGTQAFALIAGSRFDDGFPPEYFVKSNGSFSVQRPNEFTFHFQKAQASNVTLQGLIDAASSIGGVIVLRGISDGYEADFQLLTESGVAFRDESSTAERSKEYCDAMLQMKRPDPEDKFY